MNSIISRPGEDLAPMLQKLQLWRPLDDVEQRALLALPYEIQELRPHDYIVRDGDRTTRSCLLICGLAYRQKVASRGARSILALHMRGDVVDLQNSLLQVADHSVQALTCATVAFIPREAVIDLAVRYPNIGLAMWYDTLVDGSIAREWNLNVSRRDGVARIAHVLCEFGVRLESLGLATRHHYELPLTQVQLGDAVGMSPMHVHRMLRALEAEGVIEREVRSITVLDWLSLAKLGDFRDRYLHLDQRPPTNA